MSLPLRCEVQALVRIRPNCEWFAHSLVPSHASAYVGSVSDHRAADGHQVPRVPLPDLGVTLIRETFAASCEDITPRSWLLRTHSSIPFGSPLLRPKPRSRSLCRLLPAPAAGGTFPTLSLRILPGVPGPLSRRSRGVHLPVSSSTSTAFPRTLSRSASRLSPSKRFHDGSLFRDCSHFVMFRPSSLLASQIVPTAAAYLRRAAEAFTSELNMLRCLRMHRIC